MVPLLVSVYYLTRIGAAVIDKLSFIFMQQANSPHSPYFGAQLANWSQTVRIRNEQFPAMVAWTNESVCVPIISVCALYSCYKGVDLSHVALQQDFVLTSCRLCAQSGMLI